MPSGFVDSGARKMGGLSEFHVVLINGGLAKPSIQKSGFQQTQTQLLYFLLKSTDIHEKLQSNPEKGWRASVK